MKKAITAIFALSLLLFSTVAYAQAGDVVTDFQKDPDNPIYDEHDIGNPAVLRTGSGTPKKIDGKYWIAFTYGSPSNRMYLAYSSSSWGFGMTWHVKGQIWEGNSEAIGTNTFLYMPNQPNPFWLFYSDDEPNRNIRIIKTDAIGLTGWFEDRKSPVFSYKNSTWSRDGPEDFSAQQMKSGKWVALFEGDGATFPEQCVGIASTSSDLPNEGWRCNGRVTSINSSSANPALVRVGDKFVTFYESVPHTGKGSMAWVSESNFFDGEAWHDSTHNPIITNTQSWERDKYMAIPNGLVRHNGYIYCFYNSGRGPFRPSIPGRAGLIRGELTTAPPSPLPRPPWIKYLLMAIPILVFSIAVGLLEYNHRR